MAVTWWSPATVFISTYDAGTSWDDSRTGSGRAHDHRDEAVRERRRGAGIPEGALRRGPASGHHDRAGRLRARVEVVGARRARAGAELLRGGARRARARGPGRGADER